MVSVYHEQSARLEMSPDAFQTHYLVLWGVEILEGMPRDDHKVKCFIQFE